MTSRFASSPRARARKSSRVVGWVVAACAVAVAQPAVANTLSPSIVGAVPAANGKLSDARLVGPSGQIYAPTTGNLLQWTRRGLGGVAATVVFAGRHNRTIYAAGPTAPLYVLRGGVWHAQPLPNRGRASLATTGRVGAASVGGQVYTLIGEHWRRFGKTNGRVSAVWAGSASIVYVANDHGRLRRGRKAGNKATWSLVGTPLPRGDYITALIGPDRRHLYALSRRGELLRIRGAGTNRVPRQPSLRGLIVHTATVGPGNQLVAVGRLADGKAVVAMTRAGRLVDPKPITGVHPRERLTAILYGAQGTIIVATRSGRLLVRDVAKVWKTAAIQVAPIGVTNRFPQAAPARTH